MQQSAIVWPEAYLPGTTDNFASNEIIVSGLTATDIWAQLNDTTLWPTYYSNVADIRFHDGSGPMLSANARFRFATLASRLKRRSPNMFRRWLGRRRASPGKAGQKAMKPRVWT
jgi:hypothetical protein